MTCVDTWLGSVEHNDQLKAGLFERFQHNIRPYAARVTVRRGRSHDVLRTLPFEIDRPFDVIYIDGDHHAPAVLTDAVLAFPMLRPGGALIFDDYAWTSMPDPLDRPAPGVEAFVHVFQKEVEVLHAGYQVILRRRLPPGA